MITLTELAAELGIEQGPEQPYPPADVLCNFDGTIERGTNEITDAHADVIRDAWRRGQEEADSNDDL